MARSLACLVGYPARKFARPAAGRKLSFVGGGRAVADRAGAAGCRTKPHDAAPNRTKPQSVCE